MVILALRAGLDIKDQEMLTKTGDLQQVCCGFCDEQKCKQLTTVSVAFRH